MHVSTTKLIHSLIGYVLIVFLVTGPKSFVQGQSSFDLSAQFDDFTTIIADGVFLQNDHFNLPAGDCHTDLSFVLSPTGTLPKDGMISVAATNTTTGAFLQVGQADAFGDFIIETDDLTAGSYLIQIDFTDNINPAISLEFQLTIGDRTSPVIGIPGGTLSLVSPSICEADRLQVWNIGAIDDCGGASTVSVESVTESNFFNGQEVPYTFETDLHNSAFGLLVFDLSSRPFQQDPDLDNLFYTVEVRAQDISGNTSTKTFSVQVDSPSKRGINSLACNDTVRVQLGENCTAPLGPDAVLEGLPEACSGEYYVKVAYPYEGFSYNEVSKCGVFKYTVLKGDLSNKDSEEETLVCWGYVQAEDLKPPVACINKVVGLKKVPGSSVPVKQHGAVVDTQIDADYFGGAEGKKVFQKIDGTFYKYEPVTTEDPDYCQGDGIDVAYDSNDSAINLLIVSDMDSIFNVTASYTDSDYSYYTGMPLVQDNCSNADALKLIRVTDRLESRDCDYLGTLIEIPNRLLVNQIIRTFHYEDEKGNQTSVEQTICFFKPIIQLPDCKIHVDFCKKEEVQELTPAQLVSYPTFINGACIEISVNRHVGDVTATYEDVVLPGPVDCGDKIIRTWTILDWCWSPLKYQNIDLVESNELCPAPVFSDWKQKKLHWEQYLVYGAKEPPVILCPEVDPEWYGGAKYPVISVNATNCRADFLVPAPIIKRPDARTDCAYQWTVEVLSEEDELWHGVPTGNKVKKLNEDIAVEVELEADGFATKRITIKGLMQGIHYLEYRVKDQCGLMSTSSYCPILVIDEVEPVAICNEDINISIGENYARIYADDVDEGSFDACSAIQKKIRRFVSESCVEAFIETSAWTLEDLYLATNGDVEKTEAIVQDKAGTASQGTVGYFTPWADFVDFNCCDGNTQVLIELQITDNGNQSFTIKREPIFGDEIEILEGLGRTAQDNVNVCWLEANLEDKITPICNAPDDREINCIDIPYSLPEVRKHTAEEAEGITWGTEELNDPDNRLIVEWLNTYNTNTSGKGGLSTTDNCGSTVKMIEVRFFLNCQAGYIDRIFQATDTFGLNNRETCIQRLWVNRVHDYCILFPADANLTCNQVPNAPPALFESLGCDLLAISHQDERFNTDIEKGDESGCYKIFRTYRVINWCQLDAELDPDIPLVDRFDSDLDVAPLVISRDQDCDRNPGNRNVFVRFVGLENKNRVLEGCAIIGFNCNLPTNLVKNVDRCGLEAWDYTAGFYQYTQVIRVQDNIDPLVDPFGETSFPSYATLTNEDAQLETCRGPVSLSFDVVEDCTPDDVSLSATLFPDPSLGLGPIQLWKDGQQTAEGATFNFSIPEPDFIDFNIREYKALGDFPLGKHRLRLRGIDGCGLNDEAFIDFDVFDDKPIAPICLESLSTNIMPIDVEGDGTVDDEKQAVVWAKDFIASEVLDCSGPLVYSIEKADAIFRGETPDSTRSSLVLNCSDVGNVPVLIYAWDQAGNFDFCQSTLRVTDANTLCGKPDNGDVTITGLIHTENEREVSGVEMQLSGQEVVSYLTDANGQYEFTLRQGIDYTVTPFNDLDPRNGVSTFDLVVISRHILGIEALDSPYKMIAADVNNSRSITTLDLISIRKLVLNIDRKFVHNTSWRFVQSAYNFEDPTNPWLNAFPEVLNINNLSPDQLINGDFIAIKTGDVTNDAQVGDLLEPREAIGPFELLVQDQDLQQGVVVAVPFYPRTALDQVAGFQFTLHLGNELTLQEIQPGLLKDHHFGLNHRDEGVVTVSWNPFAVEDWDQPLFILVVKAQSNQRLSRLLELGSLYTEAEAYTTDGERLLPALHFSNVRDNHQMVLHQNQPNPFNSETTIGFELSSPRAITFSVSDLNGRILKTSTKQYSKGKHTIELTNVDLPKGVLYYSISDGKQQLTKKLIVL